MEYVLIKRIDKICNSIIIISVLTLISSIVTAIGFKVWFSNFTTSGFSSESQLAAYYAGGYTGMIGGIITVFLAIMSTSLLVYRTILKKRAKITLPNSAKMTVSTTLFIFSLSPLIIVFLIELFRNL